MSRLVDERIVEMSFDNSDFEKHTKESMKTIDALKEKLDFSKVADSLNESFDSVDTSVLSKGLEKVSDGFSTLEIAAISAVSNITNKLVNLGTNLVKSLSIDNITAGWQKYADTTVSVGTLISQGFDMDTVTEQLEKLQFFTDETSYTFTDMVSNIGKFTAAGQDLETSVEAMMGIANWAALSGQNAQTASRAMYQLSQAMGAGAVKLQDYRSIQTANMDTTEFRKTVLETALDVGTLTDSIDGMYQTASGKRFSIDQFTEYLSEGWFTSDILVKALNKYSSAVDQIYQYTLENDVTASEAIEALNGSLDEFGMKAFKASQEARTFEDVINSVKEAAGSGFSNIFQSIFGAYDKAKQLWTDLANELYDLFIEPINYISDAVDKWSELGRGLLFENTEEASGAFWDIYYALSEISNIFRESFLKVFNIETTDKLADKLLEITKSIKAFTEQLKISEDLGETLSNIFSGFASIIKSIYLSASSIIKGLRPAFSFVIKSIRKILDIISDISKRITNFVNSTTLFKDIEKFLSDFLGDIFKFVDSLKIFDKARERINRFFEIFKNSGGTFENVKKILKDISTIVNYVKDAFIQLVDSFMTYVYPIIEPVLDIVLDSIPVILGTIVKWVAYLSEFLLGLFDVIKNGKSFSDVIDYISTSFGKIGEAVSAFFKKIGSLFTKENLDKMSEIASMLLSKLTDLFSALGSLLLSLFDLAVAALPIIQQFLSYVATALNYINKKLGEIFNGNGYGADLIKYLLVFAETIAILVALKWKFDTIQSMIAPISYIMESLADLLDSFAQGNYTSAMLNFALAILVIVGGIVLLASIDKDKLKPAVAVMAGIMVLMFLMLMYMKNMVEGIKSIGDFNQLNRTINSILKLSTALILIATSMLIATVPLLLLAKYSWDKILLGILGYAAVVGAMVLFVKVISKQLNAGEVLKAAVVLNIMAMSLIVASVPLLIFSKLNWDQLLAGITGLGMILVFVTLAALVFSLLGQVVKEIALGSVAVALMSVTLLLTAVAFKAIGMALLECVKPFQELSKMSWGDIGRATVGLLSIVLILTILSAVSPLLAIGLVAALGMVALSGALLAFLVPLKEIIKLPLDKLNNSFKTLLKTVVLLSLVANVLAILGPLTGLIASFNLSLLSVSLLAFILPLKEITYLPFDRLNESFKSLIKNILLLSVIANLLTIFGSVKLSLLSLSFSLLGASLLALSAGIPPFVHALQEVEKLDIGTILSVFGKLILIGLGLGILSTFISPLILDVTLLSAALSPLLLILTGLVAVIGLVLGSVAAILTVLNNLTGEKIQNGIVSIAKGLKEAMPDLLEVVHQLMEEVNALIIEGFKMLIKAFYAFITENQSGIGAILATVFEVMITSLMKIVPHYISSFIDGLSGILEDKVPELADSVLGFLKNMLNVIAKRVPELYEALNNFLDSFTYSLAYNFVSFIPRTVRTILRGFKDAFRDEWNAIKNEAPGLIKTFMELIEKTFGINSPSTKMREIGEYVGEGLRLGILDKRKAVYDSAEELGSGVDEGLADSKISSAIFSFIDLLNGELDENQIVITPILDLSEIQNGKDSLFGMFGDGINLSGSYAEEALSNISTRRENISNLLGGTQTGTQVATRETILNNTFNITGENPEAIANEISKILQTQVDRRNAKWAT